MNGKNEKKEALIGMAEIARRLGVTRQRIYYLIMDNRLKAMKINGKNYFTEKMLSDYIAEWKTVKQPADE